MPNTDTIQSVSLQDETVVIEWAHGLQQSLESIQLRHSPGFPGANRPSGPDGRFSTTSSHLSICVAELTNDGDLRLKWHPGEVVSIHQAAWLGNSLLNDSELSGSWLSGTTLWDASTISSLPIYDFHKLNSSELARLRPFDQILDSGVCLVHDVPLSSNAIQTIAKWFGQMSPNPYADNPNDPTLASIRVDPKNPVATRMCHFLGPHTDTCWRQTLTGLLFMHCIKAHPDGGRSLLVDGFTVANRLREIDFDAFELLSTVPINFEAKVSEQDEWRSWGRVISVTADGVIQGIKYNGNSIGHLQLPRHLIAPMLRALEKFESILYDRDLWWQPRLQPGEALVIDNHRVLHGREAFDPTTGERHLTTCSVDRDDFHNNYRRIARKLGGTRWNQKFSAGVI